MTVADKREAVSLMKETELSATKGMRLLAISRSVLRYGASKKDDAMLREKIRVVAFERRRYGYRRIAAKILDETVTWSTQNVSIAFLRGELESANSTSKETVGRRGEMAVIWHRIAAGLWISRQIACLRGGGFVYSTS